MSNVDNIIAVYHQAVAEDILDGADWYHRARQECQELADRTGVSLEVAIAVVSVISPRMRWDENIQDAEGIIRGSKWSRAFRKNADKAREFVRTGKVDLKGPKVSSFYQNILDPNDPEVVVVDTWAWRIWANETRVKTIDPRLYWRVAADYREAASRIGITPSVLQAITWEYVRRKTASPMEEK